MYLRVAILRCHSTLKLKRINRTSQCSEQHSPLKIIGVGVKTRLAEPSRHLYSYILREDWISGYIIISIDMNENDTLYLVYLEHTPKQNTVVLGGLR